MEYRELGRTGLRVSLAGLGTGGPARIGQSAGLPAADSHRLIREALDLGINLFDTSPAYGGSEELLGGGLVGVPRDRYILATKFPPYARDGLKGDPQALMRQVEDSLRAMRVDHIEVLQYHGVRPASYREVIDRFHPVALEAQRQGKIGYIGITETAADDPEHRMLETALAEDLFDTCMIKHGILNQVPAQRVLPLAEAHRVGVFVMASVRRSLRSPEEALATFREMESQGLVEGLSVTPEDPLGLAAVAQPVPSLTRAAYQFAAQSQAVSTVLVGTGNIEHLRQNVADILSPGLSAEQMAHLQRTFGHLSWPT